MCVFCVFACGRLDLGSTAVVCFWMGRGIVGDMCAFLLMGFDLGLVFFFKLGNWRVCSFFESLICHFCIVVFVNLNLG